MSDRSHAARSSDATFFPREAGARRAGARSPGKRLRLDRSARAAAISLLAVLALFEITTLDSAVQDRLFDSARRAWLVDTSAVGRRIFFHELPHAIAIGVGGVLLALLLGPARWRVSRHFRLSRRALLCAAATLASIPASVALGKKLTNVHCPRDLERYGGDVCYVRLTEPFPVDATPNRRGSCFPGGHASGGFALIAVWFLARTRRAKSAALLAALTLGWIAGTYQMMAGVHFLSHTLVAMCLAWLWFVFWRRVYAGKLSLRTT